MPKSPILSVLGLTALLVTACSPRELNDAKAMVRQQKFYNAIELYMSFANQNPTHRRAPEALFEAGNIQQMILNEQEKAISTFRTLVGNYPVSEYTLKAQRRVAEIQKNYFANYAQSIIEYEKLLRADPQNAEAPSYQFEIAQCYTLLHNYDQAAIEYQTLVNQYPKDERLDEVYFQMGNNAYINGKYTEAISAYEILIQRFPKSPLLPQARFGIGNSYEEMNEFAKARAEYQAVLNNYPSPKVVGIRLQALAERERKKSQLAPGSHLRH